MNRIIQKARDVTGWSVSKSRLVTLAMRYAMSLAPLGMILKSTQPQPLPLPLALPLALTLALALTLTRYVAPVHYDALTLV